MNAQDMWKTLYEFFRNRHGAIKRDLRNAMKECRREAALERALEAERRKMDRLRNVAHNAVSYVGAANYADREQEAHDRIDAA